MFKHFELLNKETYNTFLLRLKSLEDNFFEHPDSKTDLLSLEETMLLLPLIYQNLSKLSDSLNKEAAESLRKNLLDKFSLEHLSYKVRPFSGKQIELSFERDKESISLVPNSSTLSDAKNLMASFIGEAKTLVPKEGEISIDLKDLKSLLGKSANGIKFDIKDNQGKAVEIDKILKEGKDIANKFNPLTPETSGIIPFEEETLEDLVVKIKSELPVKIEELQLVNIDFNRIASTEIFETDISEIPFKGIRVDSFDRDTDDLRHFLFDTTLHIWIGETLHEVKKAREVIFGEGISDSSTHYLNIQSPVYQFKVKALATLKQPASKDAIADLEGLEKVEELVTKEALKEGIKLERAFGDIEVFRRFENLTRDSAESFDAEVFELPLPYREFENYPYLKVRLPQGNVLSLGTEVTDSTFVIESGILKTNYQGTKRLFYDNQFEYDFEKDQLVVSSKLPITNLKIKNSLLNRLLRKEYGVKEFQKYDVDVVSVPFELSIESVRTFLDNAQMLELTLGEGQLPGLGEYIIREDRILVYLEEGKQRFGKVIVNGQETRYEPLTVKEMKGKFYVKGDIKEETQYLQSGSLLPENALPSSLQIPGYVNLSKASGTWIKDLRLPVTIPFIGLPELRRVTIPFTPLTNLTVPFENYTLEDNVLNFNVSDYPGDYITISFFHLREEPTNIFEVSEREVRFVIEPPSPVMGRYFVFEGINSYDLIKEIPFEYEDSVLKANIEVKNALLKYLKGGVEEVSIFHPRKIYLETFNLYEL